MRSFENEIKVREELLFTYYFLMPETNVASQTIYPNQQFSDSGKWQAIRKKRFGYLKVEDFNLADIQVRAEGSNLFHLEHSRHRHPINGIVNVLAAIAAYIHYPNKPSITLT